LIRSNLPWGRSTRVVLNARGAGKLEDAAGHLRQEDATVFTAAFDVTSGESVSAAIARPFDAPTQFGSMRFQRPALG
jgi:hypothetical protein